MATSKKKNGTYSGKIGNTVTYVLNGQWVQRSIGINNNPPSILQLTARMVLRLLAELFKPVKGLISVGFAPQKKNSRLNAHNIATIENQLRAIKGEYPDMEIDYPNVIFSKGDLPVTANFKVTVIATGLFFTWDTAEITRGMLSTDRVMMIAYCPAKKYAFYDLDGARREEGNGYLPMLRYREQVIIHTYAAFISACRKRVSTTVYTGEYLW